MPGSGRWRAIRPRSGLDPAEVSRVAGLQLGRHRAPGPVLSLFLRAQLARAVALVGEQDRLPAGELDPELAEGWPIKVPAVSATPRQRRPYAAAIERLVTMLREDPDTWRPILHPT